MNKATENVYDRDMSIEWFVCSGCVGHCAPTRKKAGAPPVDPFAELDAAITTLQRAWSYGANRPCEITSSIAAIRAEFDRLRGSAPEPDILRSFGYLATQEFVEPVVVDVPIVLPDVPTTPEPSAPTGRDPDCAYCVRLHPDERCTCVPSVNSPVEQADDDDTTWWLIHFEDQDHGPEMFGGLGAEIGARARLIDARQAWACHLFVSVNVLDARDAEIATLLAT